MEPSLQIIDVGSVRLRVALAGEGPLVVLERDEMNPNRKGIPKGVEK